IVSASGGQENSHRQHPSRSEPFDGCRRRSNVARPSAQATPSTMWKKIRAFRFGAPKDVHSAQTFHSISLIAILAWVGLGADGLSSSAYGPDEAFRALGDHGYLALGLAVATTVT